MIGIYKIENLITHKIYIGQSIDIKERWKIHRYPSTYLDPTKETYYYKLYTAFREYGLENFHFSIIEECSQEQLNEQELYWINYYNSYNEGYNMTLGGDGINRPSDKAIYQYDRLGNFIQEFPNPRSAAEALHTSIGSIYCAICDKHLGAGYQWSYERVDKMPFYENNEDPVIAYDLDGNIVKLYNSIQEAARITGDGWHLITTACKNKQYISGLYQWRYAKEFRDIKKIQPCLNYSPIAINQYDLKGNFINSYRSLNDAIKELNLKEASNLSTCLKKQQKSFNGYLWTYYNEPAPTPYIDQRIGHKTSSTKRTVAQFTKDNKFIQTYESAHEAARAISKPKSANHITECCQGKRKTCEGYIWKYSEE